jgi:hypothetical protein
VTFYLHTSTYYLLYAYHLRRFCRFILQGFHWELLQGEGSLEALIHSISLTLYFSSILLFIHIHFSASITCLDTYTLLFLWKVLALKGKGFSITFLGCV